LTGIEALCVIAAGLGLLAALWRRADPEAANEILKGPDHDRQPWEPCWTEELAADGQLSYGRSCCVHSDLMEVDSRADRGVFPIPRTHD
jgi:hypothetical protein